MNVPEETVKSWMRLIDWHLRQYERHVDHEEIVAIGYFTLARLLRGVWGEGGGAGSTLLLNCVSRAVADFLASPQNRERRYNRDKKPTVQWLSIEASQADARAGLGRELCPHVPDFVPPLLDRLEVERRLARLSPRKRAALLLHCYHGMSYAEVARALCLTERQARRACAGVRVPGTMQRGGR